jgi:pimeloyl-ACP methyl ester carboxylesterase
MKLVADDLQSVIIPGSGHWVAEQAPEQLVAALGPFLAPYLRAAQRTVPASAAV